jgi:hypothetical protein
VSEPSLLAEIAAHKTPQRGPQCTVALALTVLPEADRSDLMVALAGPYSNKAIAVALRSRDMAISHITVGRHRRGDCLCAPTS